MNDTDFTNVFVKMSILYCFKETYLILHWLVTNNFFSKVKTLNNGENDPHKRQFLALGVHSQSWILDNLSKKISCQIDWCYKLLATI